MESSVPGHPHSPADCGREKEQEGTRAEGRPKHLTIDLVLGSRGPLAALLEEIQGI